MDVKKIYIDTRYKTEDSVSDSDFFIELPRSFNVPENCICYIDDFVIPVSWPTVDDRNDTLYLNLRVNVVRPAGPTTVEYFVVAVMPSKNYVGATFASELERLINEAVIAQTGTDLKYEVSFDQNDNLISITQTHPFNIATTRLISVADLKIGKWWSEAIPEKKIRSINGMIRLGKETYELTYAAPYVSYIDLHTTRNLYLTSSALASYSNISNFKNDVIVKKIPITARFGQMLFYNASTGYDYLHVSKRQLNRIDFRLQDSYGNIVNLRNNHFSFSLIFSEK
jgi:hypothetical protein